jgi:two-component sensor histidine kinase
VINFQEIPDKLSIEQKRQLCQFLEESIGNVGKYAVGGTRLQLLGKVNGAMYRLSVEDNGQGEISDRLGDGTKQAQRLAASLGGRFERFQNRSANGVICFIEWDLS